MKEIYDLRSFMEVLEENNQLVTINKEVSIMHEMANVVVAMTKQGNMGAPYFKNLKENPGTTMIGDVLGSMDRISLAMNCPKKDITDFLGKCLENPIPVKKVEKAPCQENVIMGDDIDLTKMPIPFHAPEDSGRYITSGVIVGKSINSTRQNLSFQRMELKGKNVLGLLINEWRHLNDFYKEAEAEGKPMPVSVVIGADPVVYIGAGLRYDGDEMEVAGAIRNKPQEVVKCITNDIYVPATAEWVIEGFVPPFEREQEGPLSEYTRHYGPPYQAPVLHVTAVTHRNGAIYQMLASGFFEHINLGNVLPREPLVKKNASYVSKNVLNVHIPPYGSGFMAIVQIHKTNPGEPKNVALAAMMSYVNIRNVVVVDEDVDIYNPSDVLWALTNNVRPDVDVFYVPDAQGHECDPCCKPGNIHTKVGIDATAFNEAYKMVSYPEIDLDSYLNS